jgi:hypothetical protein
MTGDRMAHPVLLTLANIKMNVRMKASNHALPLIALLPVPKFVGIHKDLRGVLENRVMHMCLDVITDPLKDVARNGAWMCDPVGNRRFCFTPLVSYIADTPEAAALAGVGGKTSHLTMAFHSKFGDSFRHEARTVSTTLAQLNAIASHTHPWDLEEYVKQAKLLHLNGVHLPFWRDWTLPSGIIAEPTLFLTPEPLHHWHKEFWDHDVKWVIRALGGDEINFRFSSLPIRVGFRHFKAGISGLKQVTGRDQRDIQRYLIGVMAVASPKELVLCVRGLMDLRYLAQSHTLDDHDLAQLTASLKQFHDYKQIILDLQLRGGAKKKPINHFYIPKLELLHSIVPSIAWAGATIQWSADPTERAHITLIKNPAENTNNGQHGPQICRHLDRDEKRRQFDLAVSILEAGVDVNRVLGADCDSDDDSDDRDGREWMGELDTTESMDGPSRRIPDFFEAASELLGKPSNTLVLPLRVFSTPTTAFRVNHRPDINKITVDALAERFDIPDLRAALADFLAHYLGNQDMRRIGGRRIAQRTAPLPFEEVQVWFSVKVQTYSCDGPGIVPPQKLMASPPSNGWPQGRCDTAMYCQDVNNCPDSPPAGLEGTLIISLQLCSNALLGFTIAQLRLILHPIWRLSSRKPLFLSYCQRFDIVPQAPSIHANGPRLCMPDPVTGMFVLKRALRSNESRVGDIIPLSYLRMPVYLTPKFGQKADTRLTAYNSLEYSKEFFLNRYYDKDIFHFLRNAS